MQVVDGEQTPGGDPDTSPNLENIVDIGAGAEHSIALEKPGGYVWCWGKNKDLPGYDCGQLGNNSTSNSSTPVQVVGLGGSGVLDDMEAVCGGAYSSYALDANSTVWAWGNNYWGQLGQGYIDTSAHSTPVQVKKGAQGEHTYYLYNITAISAGNKHVLALDEDGGVWAWGYNEFGQLGNDDHGAGKYEDEPVRVKCEIEQTIYDLTDIVYIDAGYEHSTAVDKYGRFWVWGANGSGQLGLNHTNNEDCAKLMPMP